MILISPAVRAVRSLHPDAHISIFVGDWSRASVEGNRYIDEIISYPDEWIQNKKPLRILSLVNLLRKKKFDRVYIFHSHNMLHLLVKLAGIPERYGFSFQGTGRFLTAATEWEPNTSRYIADNYLDIPRLAGWKGDDCSLDLFLSSEDEAAAEQLLKDIGISPGSYFIIAPGGGLNPRQNVFHKRWGAEKFAQLIDLMKEDWESAVILVGAADEKDICREIEDKPSFDGFSSRTIAPRRMKISRLAYSRCRYFQSKPSCEGLSSRPRTTKYENSRLAYSRCRYFRSKVRSGMVNLCGATSFGVSAALVKQSLMLICNDSSLMHAAAAFHKPSIAIFGPSNPQSLLPQAGLNRYVSAGLECSPCYCNSIFDGCERELACMAELSPQKVHNAIKELLVEYRDLHKIFRSDTIL